MNSTKPFVLFYFLCCLILCSFTTTGISQTTISVSGYVYDNSPTPVPIEGATIVDGRGNSSTTDSNGFYTLAEIDPDSDLRYYVPDGFYSETIISFNVPSGIELQELTTYLVEESTARNEITISGFEIRDETEIEIVMDDAVGNNDKKELVMTVTGEVRDIDSRNRLTSNLVERETGNSGTWNNFVYTLTTNSIKPRFDFDRGRYRDIEIKTDFGSSTEVIELSIAMKKRWGAIWDDKMIFSGTIQGWTKIKVRLR